MKQFLLLALLFSSLAYAQETDTLTAKNYDQEIQLLKKRIDQLENSSKKNTEKLNIIDRTKIGFDAIFRVGEVDWNQNEMNPKTGDVTYPNSRFWTRILFFLNVDTKINDKFDFRFSLMTHPYFAFGDDSDTKISLALNELWLDYKPVDNQVFRLGRQSASRIWDNRIGEQFDWITHDGLTYLSNYKLGKNLTLDVKGAYFTERYVNNAPIKNQGKMYGGSVKLSGDNPNNSWQVGTGLLQANKMPNTMNMFYSYNDRYLLMGDLAPQYSLLTNHLGITFKNLSNLGFNANIFYNLKNYRQNPPSNLITDKAGNSYFTNDKDQVYDPSTAPDFSKQKFGIYANASVDFTLFKKGFSTSLAYLYMEKYAALDYFAQYDLARWNSTNVKGPEFTLVFKLNKWMKIRSRTFLMKEIKGLNGIDPNFRRSGNRSRLDLIISF